MKYKLNFGIQFLTVFPNICDHLVSLSQWNRICIIFVEQTFTLYVLEKVSWYDSIGENERSIDFNFSIFLILIKTHLLSSHQRRMNNISINRGRAPPSQQPNQHNHFNFKVKWKPRHKNIGHDFHTRKKSKNNPKHHPPHLKFPSRFRHLL